MNKALVVGASGIIGSALVDLLIAEGWEVAALARRPGQRLGVTAIAADLTDAEATRLALAGHAPTHVFITTWSRQANERENIRVNAAMVRHLLDGLRPAGSVRHVGLVTGLKHYLGPFEAYGKGVLRRRRFVRNRAVSTWTISTTRRKTRYSRPLPAMGSPGTS